MKTSEQPAPFTLPEGKRMAVLFNIAYEGWETGAAPSIGPMGNPLPAGTFDYQASSWGAYGHRRGIWRLMDVFESTGTKATVFASGCLAEIAPDSLRAISEAGHEVAAHGYSQHVIPALLDVEEESSQMERCLDLLAEATGSRPRGWLSPRGTPSAATARFAAKHGLTWFGDVFDEDTPYLLPTEGGSIVAIPLKMTINDLPHHVRYGNSPRSFVDLFHDAFAAMYSSGGEGCYLDVTVHAHVFGRPEGAWTVAEMASEVADRPDVWVPTRAEMADRVLKLSRETGV